MKKNILFIMLILILIMPSFVLAATAKPLTCLYTHKSNTYRFLLIQNSDGTHSAQYIMLEGNVRYENQPGINDTKWKDTNAKIILESDTFTSCPKSAKKGMFGIGKLTFYADADKGAFKLYKSENYSKTEKKEDDDKAGIDTNQSFENVQQNSCTEKSEYKTCTYQDLTICFNDTKWEFEFRGDAKNYYLGVQSDFTLSEFLSKYKINNSCPSVYTSHSQGVMDTNLHISFTNDGMATPEDPSDSPSGDINNPSIPEFSDCESLLGNPETEGTPAYYLVIAFNVVKYVAIIMLIVLSVLDFITAIASSDQDIIMKTTRKVITRVILCVVIFLLPTLIKVALAYLSDRAADLCGIE